MTKKAEVRKEAAGNRYAKATVEEKKMFTRFAEMLKTAKFPIPVAKKELEGTIKRKFVFVLKENDNNIHTIEFLVGKGEEAPEVKGMRIFQAGSQRDSDFTTDMKKLDKEVKLAYGDRVLTWMGDDKVIGERLIQISNLLSE